MFTFNEWLEMKNSQILIEAGVSQDDINFLESLSNEEIDILIQVFEGNIFENTISEQSRIRRAYELLKGVGTPGAKWLYGKGKRALRGGKERVIGRSQKGLRAGHKGFLGRRLSGHERAKYAAIRARRPSLITRGRDVISRKLGTKGGKLRRAARGAKVREKLSKSSKYYGYGRRGRGRLRRDYGGGVPGSGLGKWLRRAGVAGGLYYGGKAMFGGDEGGKTSASSTSPGGGMGWSFTPAKFVS